MIGRGAFGEVWMARSVTGTLRAVKVVWREDYDQPEGFEREFEALKHYEPVSRKHPGLVPILQVGRSEQEGFYYYVMELADDLERGRDIDPATYRSHTLTAQMRRDKRVDADACIKLGASIAEGLHYLHQNKLIHRDVKPSNLIFINGECSLADIGLVTLLGQRTFVGTEGFVAPEGPGTAASDIFSLGMVLYEASTGKDRLDFPDLPSYRESGASLQSWRRLQDVICTACASKAGQRFENAREMALALRGEALPSHRRKMLIFGAAAAALLFTGIGMSINHMRQPGGVMAEKIAAKPLLTLRSTPSQAQVFAGEDLLGETPLELNPTEEVPTIYHLRKSGYKHYELEHTAKANKPQELDIKLERSKLPQAGERWTNGLGMEFVPKQGGHTSQVPVEMKAFRKFVEDADHPFEGKVVSFQSSGSTAYIVVVPAPDADAFRYWLTDRDRRDGTLSQEHHYEVEPFYYMDNKGDDAADMPQPDGTEAPKKEGIAFYLRVVRQTYGRVVLKTNPPGVHVFQRDESLGDTPLELPRVKTGTAEFELRMEGFTDLVVDGDVNEGEILELYADMEKRRGLTYGREWNNASGMRFVPLAGDSLVAVYETRFRDFREFTKANGRKNPGGLEEAGKNGTHPVINVTRQDARDYCAWLTKRDQESGLLGPDDVYRLPTDEEWSRAAGLPLERGETPSERNGHIRGMFPWGFEWPPPNRVDNLADAQAAKKAGLDAVIPDYDDNAAFTAPVGSLQPNERGICGLGGNVSEWVDSDFEKPNAAHPTPLATVRGGNWRTANSDEALSSYRLGVPADTKRNTIGFRLVVARKPADSNSQRTAQ